MARIHAATVRTNMIDEVVFDGAATLSAAEEEVGDDFMGEAGEDIDFNAGADLVGDEMPE